VSGQLRGYRKAFASWNHFGLEPKQVSYFVHTWTHVGRKQLLPIHAWRCLSGALLETYNEIHLRLGQAEMEARYPHFFEIFNDQGSEVTADELRNFYNTPHVVVERDDLPAFADFTNSMKMYYKISAAHRMAVTTKEPFDLYIRMRPDTAITFTDRFDWDRIQDCVGGTRKIITGEQPRIYPNGCAAMCDIIAFGDPAAMNIYASTWKFAQTLFQKNAYLGFPHAYIGHETLFWSCFYRGVAGLDSQNMFTFDLCDPDKLSEATIREAITRDLSERMPDAYDTKLLSAMQQSPAIALTG
jgi:hypothetical protein